MPGISRTRRARLGAVIGAALSAVALLSGCGAAGPVAMKTVARVQPARPAGGPRGGRQRGQRAATANGPRRVTFINRMQADDLGGRVAGCQPPDGPDRLGAAAR